MEQIEAQVTFYLEDDVEDALKTKAAEVDAEVNGVENVDYTLIQALQVVWHWEPEWVHANVLDGWTLDKFAEETEAGVRWQPVWPS